MGLFRRHITKQGRKEILTRPLYFRCHPMLLPGMFAEFQKAYRQV